MIFSGYLISGIHSTLHGVCFLMSDNCMMSMKSHFNFGEKHAKY